MSRLDLVKRLREETGAGVVAAQNALQEAADDFDKAVIILRKAGQKIAVNKQARATHEGLIGFYVHANGKVAALVALACETDFVSRGDVFKELAHDLAMQAAVTQPLYVRPEDIPESILERERDIAQSALKNSGKPKELWDQVIAGKLAKFAEENCFIKQKFIKDDSLTVEQLIGQSVAKLGENIQVRAVRTLIL